MSSCSVSVNLAIGSDNDVEATVADRTGANITDATVRYQLQETPDELNTGDPGIIDENPLLYSAGELLYRGTIDRTVSRGLEDGKTYYIFVITVSGASDDVRRLEQIATYN